MYYDKFLYGNNESKEYFARLIKNGKLSHAYLIDGPEGSGKKSLVKYIASLLMCKGGKCDDCDICRKTEENLYPDIRFISREGDKKNIGIDIVRDMISDSAMTPSELDFKLYAINNAELLSSQAQNALLKVIEEPPGNVYIFLLCNGAASVLPTVRSRVQCIKTELFKEPEIVSMLKKDFPPSVYVEAEKLKFASRLCGGSYGKAKTLLNGDGEYPLYVTAKNIVLYQSKKNHGSTYFDMLSIILKSITDRESAAGLFSYLLLAYRDIIFARFSDEAETLFFDRDEVLCLVSSFTVKSVSDSVDAVTKLQYENQMNSNINAAASALAVLLWKAI